MAKKFKKNQKVVYPGHGVAMIQKIEESSIDGTEETFYHLRLVSNDSKVMIPAPNLELVGIRPLSTVTDINKLLTMLRNEEFETYKDWKGRYKQNLEKMKTGDITEVAKVLKNLRLVSTRKSLSFREKKMYERARQFIVSEVAHVKKMSSDKAESKVEKALETSINKQRAVAAG